jgi:hypothetical protein
MITIIIISSSRSSRLRGRIATLISLPVVHDGVEILELRLEALAAGGVHGERFAQIGAVDRAESA